MKLKFTVEVFKDDDSEVPDVRAEETMTASSAAVLKGTWWGDIARAMVKDVLGRVVRT